MRFDEELLQEGVVVPGRLAEAGEVQGIRRLTRPPCMRSQPLRITVRVHLQKALLVLKHGKPSIQKACFLVGEMVLTFGYRYDLALEPILMLLDRNTFTRSLVFLSSLLLILMFRVHGFRIILGSLLEFWEEPLRDRVLVYLVEVSPE